MATFPTLTPSSRTFTPGERSHALINTMAGTSTRVRTRNVLLDQQLRLGFTALTETQMLSIRTHYATQQGSYLSFAIPNNLLSGMTTPASFTPTNYSWVYAGPPQVEDIGCQRYTVTVELVTVPPEGISVDGVSFLVTTSITAGIAYTTGFAQTVTASLAEGAASGS